MNGKIILNNTLENYNDYKNIIKEVLKDISNSSDFEYINEIKDFITLENETNLYYEYILFMNYSKFISLNIENNLNENINSFSEIKIFNNENLFNKDIYGIIFHFHIYLLNQIDNLIISIAKDSNIASKKEYINHYYQILIQILSILCTLYKEKIYNFEIIRIFFDSIVIFIKRRNSQIDKYIKIKNIIFLDLLFGKYFECFVPLILNISNKFDDNKEDIILFFNYIINIIKNNELKIYYNYEILSNNNIISKFVSLLLNKINYEKNIDIYNEYKQKFIDICLNIYKNNTTDLNFFEKLINHNKNSFINLMNYKTRKTQIINDIYIQNFYIELLHKLFSEENNKESMITKHDENYFLFNGYNSKMTLQLDKFSLGINSIIFFSFQLLEETINTIKNTSNILPLLYFNSNSGKEILSYKIYIQKQKYENKLCLYQDKGAKKNKMICLEKLGNIHLNKKYLICIKFTNKKIVLYIKKLDNKGIKYYEEVDAFDCDYASPLIKIGHDDSKNEYFKGYIGPIIIVKNIIVKKNYNLDNIIDNILNLNNLYQFFPMFLSETSFYHFNEKIIFSSFEEENEFNNIKFEIQNNILNSLCEFYLTPEILGVFYSLFMKNENEENYIFPEIPNIISDKKYRIIDMNLSLIRHNSIYNSFIRNNGFDYFILIYEYIYQFFYLINSNITEFDFYSKDDNLENIFIKTINSTLIIIHRNYLYYKHFLYNTKKLKTLFMNLYEILKMKNHKILDGISKELYELNFGFNQKINELKYSKKNESNTNKYLIEEKKIISSFSNGLTEMIFDFELYKNNNQNNSISLLFLISNKILMEYKNSNEPNKIFPFEEGFFLELLNFINVFINELNSGYDKNNYLLQNFFDLIKKYLDAIHNPIIKRNYFRQLFLLMKNNENNLSIIINYLYIIYDILSQKLFLENEEIEFLLNYLNENIQKDEEIKNNDKKKILEDINIMICNIITKQLFLDNSKELINNINSKLSNLENMDIIISNIISELQKNFEYFLNIDNYSYDKELLDSLKYIDIYENIFNFVLNLFKLILNKEKISPATKLNKINDMKENNNSTKILNLLNHIIEILKEKINNKIEIHCVFTLINLLKFYYIILFFEKKILFYFDLKFIEIFIQILGICYKYCLINSFTLFKLKYAIYEYNKTILEILFDIFLELCLTDESSTELYQKLLDGSNYIFFEIQFIDNHKYSIFYINDNLNYCLIHKKMKELTGNLKKKCNNISFYDNKLFNKQETFNGNFSTYFLPIIADSITKINDKDKFYNLPKSKVLDFLNELYSLILEEQISLYKTDKKYFFRLNTSNHYNELINYLKDKHVNRKSNIEKTKEFIETITEKMNMEKNKKLIDFNQNNNEIKENSETKKYIFDLNDKDDKEKEKISNNKINFFYELDKYYATNIKKEIMNCIFSLYYLKEFFYSEDFCIVKKYYLNNYLNDLKSFNSKKLNFPSIIKNYINNFEAPLFIKKFNNYIVNPYFPITHSYIDDEKLKRNLTMDKDIKLNKKEIKLFEKDELIECEILKNEKQFYGKLYYNNAKGYLLFKEESNNFGLDSGNKYIFLMSNLEENKTNIIENNYDKNILILLDDVEELIEIRILLLWKGFEIFLKNGKSYIFNFLTTKDYDNFMKNFIFKSKIKNLVRKRNFLSDKNITKIWVRGLLSNFDYLLLLNRYSSRSFHDLTQYPVFPWVLNNFRYLQSFIKKEKYYLKVKNELLKQQKEMDNIDANKTINNKINFIPEKKSDEINDKKIIIDEFDNKKKLFNEKKIDFKTYKDFLKNEDNKCDIILRDFRYPMALQSDTNRQAAKMNYEEEEKNGEFPIHCGCHYSNAGFIYFFLMRQQPYGNLLIKLQGYNKENPNRCFLNFTELEKCLICGSDNRELIPDLLSKIECFLNLNCDFYGRLNIKNNPQLVDDCDIEDIIDKKDIPYLSKYVNFVLQHKKVMNSKIIGFHLNKWIDNIFGVNQFPPENSRKESYNIFSIYTYENLTNLEKKLENDIKNDKTEKEIKSEIASTIPYIVNFGVSPSIIFHEAHPKIKWEIIENISNKDKTKIDDKVYTNELNDIGDLESEINESLAPKNLNFQIKGIPIYFEINSTINKIFIYIKDLDNLLILDNELYNEISYNYFSFLKFNKIVKSNILYSKLNSEYQIKYSFSSFDKEYIFDNDNNDNYHTYFYNKMKYLLNNEKILIKYKNTNFNKIMVITSRHIDFSFKIYYLEKDANEKNAKKKNNFKNKIYSFICEDFVTSCCCISYNSFLIGLNNGKLINYIIKENPIIINDKKRIEQKDNIAIEKEKYIQAHKGKINSIDIDKKLGVVITSGDDNYIFVRKLFDFELLLPIKIKNKFIILMTKVSPYNFFYVLCFNKLNKKNIIFGYTLSGIRFAKSDYGLYDNISFNNDGHIVTMNNKKELTILSGSDLTKLNISEDKDVIKNIKELKNSNWLQFDYFLRTKDDEYNEIVTFLKRKKDGNYIKTINNLFN